jgi:sphingomyelin phosphodiesterase 2
MTILREHACLTDAWAQSHDSLPRPASIISPQQALSDYGVTADSPLNSYSVGKPLHIATRRQQGKRLDYIFFRHSPKRQPDKGVQNILTATESKVVLTNNVPGYDFSLSDHFGIEATLTISQMEVGDTFHDVESGLLNSMVPSTSESCLSSAALGSTLQALMARYRTSRSQSHFQLILFVACVCVLLVIIVSSAWLPRTWFNPIFLFFTVFVSWLGTTMLYSGFIFGNWEVNALTNVIEELEFLRQGGLGASSAVLDST